MKRFLFLTLSAIVVTLASCTPKLSNRPIGEEEQEWKDYLAPMYPGWKQPETLPQAVTITSEKVPYKRDLANESSNNQTSANLPSDNGLLFETEPIIVDEVQIVETETVIENTATGETVVVDEVQVAETITEPQVTEATEYIVQKDESLSIIAKKFYGDGNKFIHIYNANKDTIKNPNRLFPGMKLIIPKL